MLYPDFNELIQLGKKASRLNITSGKQSMAASSGDYASPFRGQGLEFTKCANIVSGTIFAASIGALLLAPTNLT
jgi:hypothetical protein